GIMPDIAAVAAELAELDIVAMSVVAVFKDKDEFVLTAVERAHSGIVLDPDAEVFQLAISVAASGQQLCDVPPIHADVVQGSLSAECRKVAESVAEKGGKFGAVHLARGHREWAMVDRAEATGVSIDRHIVGRVGEHHRGAFRAHQSGECVAIESVATQHAM